MELATALDHKRSPLAQARLQRQLPVREAAAKDDLRLDLYYEPKSRTLNRVRLATASAAK